MELSNEAIRVLGHLSLAPDSYLLGPRDGKAPFNLIDSAVLAQNRSRVEWLPLVAVAVVRELSEADYIQNDTGAAESINMGFRISEKGRRVFSS
jgi:hypothetical protein